MMAFPDAYRKWHGDSPPASPLFVDSATPVDEGEALAAGKRVQIRSDHAVLVSIADLLERLVLATERGNSLAREGAASSVEIKFLAPTRDHPEGKPQPVVKVYAGSVPPVDEAIEAYGRAFLMSQQGAREGWEGTVSVLQAERAARWAETAEGLQL